MKPAVASTNSANSACLKLEFPLSFHRSMATLKPFAALRPKPELAAQICELPYDVMSSDEARTTAAGNPLSFLHVSKPEIDLPAGTNPYAPEVYAKGAENFQKLFHDGALMQDPQPYFYLYRQVMGPHRSDHESADARKAVDGFDQQGAGARRPANSDTSRYIKIVVSPMASR